MIRFVLKSRQKTEGENVKKRGESVANLVIFLLGMPILSVSVMVWVFSLRFAFWYYDSRIGEETADQSKADYRLVRINADSNENTSNTDYWFLQNDAIYHYSLPDGPLELVWECEEEQAIRNPWENGQEIYFRLEGKDYEDEGIWKMRYQGGAPEPVSEEEEKQFLDREEQKLKRTLPSVWLNGQLVTFDDDFGEIEYYYRLEDGEAQHIDCLQKWRFRKGNLYSGNLTTDREDIIGLVQVASLRRVLWFQDIVMHRHLVKEVVFRLNPETGENEILYETENNLTRIVGYHNKKIYLVRDYCIYTVDVQTGEEQELCRLWQDERKDRCDYLFDWQGDYLIVQRQDWETCKVHAVGVEE